MDSAVLICSTVMDPREVKLEHSVSIHMSLFEKKNSCIITPWFSCPEFIAKRLLVRCHFDEWKSHGNSIYSRNYVKIQVVGGDVLSKLHMVSEKFSGFSQFKIPCVQASVEVQFSAPDSAAGTSTDSFMIERDYLCTPAEKYIRIPVEIEQGPVSKWAQEGGHLVFNVRITLLVPDEPISLPFRVQQSASETLQKILSEGLHPDVKLQLQGGELPAHRAVLAACSPVFRAMFEHDMKERQSGQVDMPDVPLAAMEAALKLLYGGELSSPDLELWVQVLELADRYQLTPLTSFCEATLAARVPELPSELLLRLLVLAGHSDPRLRSAILCRFITALRDKGLGMDVRDLVRKQPDVAEEVIKFFLK